MAIYYTTDRAFGFRQPRALPETLPTEQQQAYGALRNRLIDYKEPLQATPCGTLYAVLESSKPLNTALQFFGRVWTRGRNTKFTGPHTTEGRYALEPCYNYPTASAHSWQFSGT